MVIKSEPENFLKLSETIPVVDVRSPSEFGQGHIPCAVNIPLFSDEERAVIGTLYNHSGREASVLKGLEFVGPKMTGFVKYLHQIAPAKKVLVHCWRGGMRSEHMAWLFDQTGYTTTVLTGGYKAYRRYIREQFTKEGSFLILGGMTGCGKTEILHHIAALGEQVIDLEKIAHHKGSVFGALGQEPQPTNEQFENNLYEQWRRLDFSEYIWIEHESRMIGSVTLPDPLLEKMACSPLIRVEIEKSQRIKRIVREYAGFDKELLGEAIEKISEKLGGTRTKEAMEALNQGDFHKVAGLVLEYYDKTYEHAVSRKTDRKVYQHQVTGKDTASIARKLVECYMTSPPAPPLQGEG